MLVRPPVIFQMNIAAKGGFFSALHPYLPHQSPCPQHCTSKSHSLHQHNYAKRIEQAKENLLVRNLNLLKLQKYLILASIRLFFSEINILNLVSIYMIHWLAISN